MLYTTQLSAEVTSVSLSLSLCNWMDGNLITEKTFSILYYNLKNFNVTGWLLLASDSLISSEKDPALFKIWIPSHRTGSCSICAELNTNSGGYSETKQI